MARVCGWTGPVSLMITQKAILSTNEGGECFLMVASYGYTWHDRDCSQSYSYVCEKENGDYFIFICFINGLMQESMTEIVVA